MTLDALSRLRAIAQAAESSDGVAPLDEATWLRLAHLPEPLPARFEGEGFALELDEELSLVVAPSDRARGIGTALAAASTARLAWSHADHPAARRIAERLGWSAVRELWVMRRTASGLPAVALPDGVRIRSYEPGDAEDLLRINAAAFSFHPEQGSMDAANLAERMAQPWFDPAGLLIAEVEGRMAGFHWTKRHSPTLGEVYVVAVDPASHGHGLGRLLTLAGLHHLVDGGAREVLLYVESDNAPAVAVYERLGFSHAATDTHVMYRRD